MEGPSTHAVGGRDCRIELAVTFSNRKTVRLEHLRSGRHWSPEVPIYELWTRPPGFLSVTVMHDGWGSMVVPERRVVEVDATVEAIARTLSLADGERASLEYAGDTLVVLRRQQSALLWNRSKCGQEPNHIESETYEVPWSAYAQSARQLIELAKQLHVRLGKHARAYAARDPWSPAVSGLAMRARLSTRHPRRGERVRVLLDLANQAPTPLELVNDFQWRVSSGMAVEIRLTSRPDRNALRRPPLRLQPGGVFTLEQEVAIDGPCSVDVSYQAMNDFRLTTNMVPEDYLRSVGPHFDLSTCWQGRLVAPSIAIFSLAKRWEETLQTQDFATWLKARRSSESV